MPLPVLFVRLVLDHREAFSRAYKLLTAASLHLRGLIRVVHAWWPKKSLSNTTQKLDIFLTHLFAQIMNIFE